MAQVANDLRIARLTVEQVHAMFETGILQKGEPIELIDDKLVVKDRSDHGDDPMTIGKKHNLSVQLLARLSVELKAHDWYIQLQGPVSLPPCDEPSRMRRWCAARPATTATACQSQATCIV